jgi:hypothetical protein
VRICLKIAILEREFASVDSQNPLLSLLDQDDIILQNQLWQALTSLCNQDTFVKMACVQQRAIKLLALIGPLHMYHVCAFDFLGKYLYFAPNGFSEADAMAVFNIFLRAVIQFPDATNLITSMFRFLRTAMNSDVFKSDIIDALLPILVVLGEAQERTAIVASSRQFLADLEVCRTGNRELDHALRTNVEYRECLNRYLRKYVENLKIPYGGPVSRYATAQSSIRDLLKRKLKSGRILSEGD